MPGPPRVCRPRGSRSVFTPPHPVPGGAACAPVPASCGRVPGRATVTGAGLRGAGSLESAHGRGRTAAFSRQHVLPGAQGPLPVTLWRLPGAQGPLPVILHPLLVTLCRLPGAQRPLPVIPHPLPVALRLLPGPGGCCTPRQFWVPAMPRPQPPAPPPAQTEPRFPRCADTTQSHGK